MDNSNDLNTDATSFEAKENTSIFGFNPIDEEPVKDEASKEAGAP